MADPRAIVGFKEQDPRFLTFKYDSSIVYDPSMYDLVMGHSLQVGKAVTQVSDSTVGLGAAGGVFAGLLVRVESDGFCTVQVGGTMGVPYVVATPPIVGRGVTVDGAGNVTSAGAGATLGEASSSAQVLALVASDPTTATPVAYVRRP